MECVRFIFHCLLLARKGANILNFYFWNFLFISEKKLFRCFKTKKSRQKPVTGYAGWINLVFKFLSWVFSPHYKANWKPLYSVFYQFLGIKSKIYDSCEIWNCRDKNRFYGYLDTRTFQLLSSNQQKYFQGQKKPKWMQ